MKKGLFLFLLLGCTLAVGQQTPWLMNGQRSSVTYRAVHPLHKWSGTNAQLKGLAYPDEQTQNLGRFAIVGEVRDFDSQNSNRDAHALEVLEVLDFPQVKFYCEKINHQETAGVLDGVVEFHGVKIQKTIETQIEDTQEYVRLQGEFQIKASDFLIDLPSFMLAKIDDEIRILFDVRFNKAKE